MSQLPSPKMGQSPFPIFSPCRLWPNGWMDQDGTWYGGRPHPRGLLCPMVTQPPPQKGAEPPIFDPCLLQPNGCMDHEATGYRDKPQPKRLCVRCGPSSPPQNGAEPPPEFSAHVHCGQTAGLIKMTLGTEVCLCLLYTSPSPRDRQKSRMPSSA